MDQFAPSSSQSQSSVTSSILFPSTPLQFKPFQIIDDCRSGDEFLDDSDNSYISPDFVRVHKLSSSQFADKREFFEDCMIKIHQNDPTVLSLDIDCQNIEDHELTRFIEALAFNSTLLELSILFHQKELSEVVASQLVEALKLNSTLTRLSLKDNRINDAAATQLSDLLRFNTTLLSLDLCHINLTENGITHLCCT